MRLIHSELLQHLIQSYHCYYNSTKYHEISFSKCSNNKKSSTTVGLCLNSNRQFAKLSTWSQKKDKKPKTVAEEKWLHSKEEMLRGVDYPVRYFGSAKITGPESTKQSGLICEQLQVLNLITLLNYFT